MYKTDEIGVVPNRGTSQLQGEHGLIILCFDSCNRWNTIILERSSKVVATGTISGKSVAYEPHSLGTSLQGGTSQASPHTPLIHTMVGTSLQGGTSQSSPLTPLIHTMEPSQETARKRERSEREIGQLKLEAQKRRLLFESLRPLQREALHFIQKTKSSVITIMPTGSGKTSLIWTFKKPDMCSIVFSPFKLLGQQLVKRLKEKGHAVAYPFQDADGSVYGILATADYIVLPYEAAPEAADLLQSLNNLNRLGPVWIDEVKAELIGHIFKKCVNVIIFVSRCTA